MRNNLILKAFEKSSLVSDDAGCWYIAVRQTTQLD